ncbi:hypothetical protein PC123_g24424 [Phytophthora cactorum]|nr:hypothetical protein PC123_g24424 [Phytophthora cactorum]
MKVEEGHLAGENITFVADEARAKAEETAAEKPEIDREGVGLREKEEERDRDGQCSPWRTCYKKDQMEALYTRLGVFVQDQGIDRCYVAQACVEHKELLEIHLVAGCKSRLVCQRQQDRRVLSCHVLGQDRLLPNHGRK